MKVPVKEALRYIGAAKADEETKRLADECAEELERRLNPRFLWHAFRIDRDGGEIFLPDADIILPGTMARGMLAEGHGNESLREMRCRNVPCGPCG